MAAETLDLALSKKPKALSFSAARDVEKYSMNEQRSLESGNYEEAMRHRLEVTEVRDRDAEEKQLEEIKRQNVEQRKLDDAFRKMTVASEKEAEARLRETEKKAQQRLDVLAEAHDAEYQHLEEELKEKAERMRIPSSPHLIQLRDTESRLLKAGLYDEARDVHRRVEECEKIEKKQALSVHRKSADAARQRLADRQDGERRFMLQLVADMKLKGKRELEDALRLLRQRKKNHEEDMRHAHKVELGKKMQPEVAGQKVEAHASHSVRSSTYKGSLLLVQQHGNKYMLPSLCEIQERQEEEERRKSRNVSK